jgi:general secretion pathway protein D
LAKSRRTKWVLPLALCLALPGFTVSSAAVAQSSTARATSTVTNIEIIAEGPDESVFALSVSPKVGSFSTVNTEPAKPAVLLLRAARSPSLGGTRDYRGLVRSVQFEPTDTGLAVRFSTAAPSKVTAESGGPDRLLVTVSKLTGAEAVGSRPVGSENDTLGTAHVVPPALEPPPGEEGYELVMLKYADVSEVVGLLAQGVSVKPNNVFIRREPGFGSMSATSGTSYVSPNSQGSPDAQPLGETVDAGMAVDRRLNAIWLRGSPDHIARMKEMIAQIDVPVDSVILETQFVELTEQGSRNIGVDFTNASGQLAVGTVQRGGLAPFGSDLSKNIYSFQIQAALYAQVQKGNGRIVSTPRIAAQSGDTAKILTGDALPILTSIALSGVNAVQQQVQYVNVGVTLQIAPRVSPDGFVTSHIYAVVSSVTGFQQGYPTISQREAETSASVRDGETFVIGGLTMDNALTTHTKVPLFGDLPLLGQLFRVDKTNKSKTDLYIVITPHVVRHRRFGDFDEPTPPPPADIGTKPQVPAGTTAPPIPQPR